VAYHRHFGHLTTSLKSLKSRVCKGGQSRSKSKEPLLANKHLLKLSPPFILFPPHQRRHQSNQNATRPRYEDSCA
jgi:hypothetical protein